MSGRNRFFALAVLIWQLILPISGTSQGDEPRRPTNRLAKETSPYLLQHAHNPVDWYPWGQEALKKAKAENKPIFLSVGYSSCHWCHVMERESFTDEEIATFLNQHFICIKVDREERPDVDAIYMTAVQVFSQLTGGGRGGGWPMSVFLTPETEPFFAGTYFPARDGDRKAATGFFTIAKRIQEIWTKEEARVREDGKTLTKYLKLEMERRKTDVLVPLDSKTVAAAASQLSQQFDSEHGGFGADQENPHRPKFPEPSNLVFLLERARRGDRQSQQMLETTLEKMSLGGIRDHLGGGFHRYSVDRFWRIPHFEKMLYDNGQLTSVYAEAFDLTKRDDFRRVVEELLEFVQREMTSPDGAFYSAIDADSEHEEGKFYRWDAAEIQAILGENDSKLISQAYGLNEPANFEEHFHVLQLSQPLLQLAQKRKQTESQLDAILAPQRKQLLDVRDRRQRPMTDVKIITAWNGLMIRGYADAGRLLENDKYTRAAERAANFVLTNLRTKEGELQRTYSQGRARLNAYLDDYAFLVDGLVALHRATNDARWLNMAAELTDRQIELFWDADQGGFFFTANDHEELLARAKDPVDGAEPSGNSVSADNLLYMANQLGRADYTDRADKTIRASGSVLQQSPLAATRMVTVLSKLLESRADASKK